MKTFGRCGKADGTVMRTGAIICLAVAAMLLPGRQAAAQPLTDTPARSSMLVSTAWLAEHARDANLVVLQVGTRAQFDSVHIPGARAVTLADVSLAPNESKLSLELPPPERLKVWAQSLGISNNSRIVIVPYDSVLQSSTRVFMTLAYMGAMGQTSLLNGGLAAWRAEARPVSADAPVAPAAGSFNPAVRPQLIAAMRDVENAVQDHRVTIIDARLPRFYAGDGGGYPRAGHIPNAINVPLTTVSTNGFLKDDAALHQLFSTAGVVAGKPVITYCHIGQQASLLWFVSTLLGYDARMYDGSFQEWSSTERLPVIGKP